MFLLGCKVPRLDLLQVICSTTPQAIEEMVSFADLLIQLFCTASPLVMYQNFTCLHHEEGEEEVDLLWNKPTQNCIIVPHSKRKRCSQLQYIVFQNVSKTVES